MNLKIILSNHSVISKQIIVTVFEKENYHIIDMKELITEQISSDSTVGNEAKMSLLNDKLISTDILNDFLAKEIQTAQYPENMLLFSYPRTRVQLIALSKTFQFNHIKGLFFDSSGDYENNLVATYKNMFNGIGNFFVENYSSNIQLEKCAAKHSFIT